MSAGRRRLVVVGAGGFGREVLDVVADLIDATGSYELVGVVDASPASRNLERLSQRGVAYLGTDNAVLDRSVADAFIVGIGDPRVRELVVGRYLAAGLTPATLIHPTVTIGRATVVGEGVVLCAGAVVSTNVRVGRFVSVNPNATIGHDAVLEPFVSINPGAIISGEVVIGAGTLVGAGAVVLEGLTVGARSIVGASACVTRDVSPGTVVKGVPAR